MEEHQDKRRKALDYSKGADPIYVTTDGEMMRSVSLSACVVVDRVDGGEEGNRVVAASWRVNSINRITGQMDKMGIE